MSSSDEIIVVDYGMGNIGSILNMIRKAGGKPLPSGDPAIISNANTLVLPGVGAFDSGMRRIEERGLIPALNMAVIERKVPIIGPCLGMHLFTRGSEEGKLPGLGWFDASTRRFSFNQTNSRLKIPHMGWNIVAPVKNHSILDNVADDTGESRFYFVHSFHVVCNNDEDVLLRAHHGDDFVAAIQRDNIIGVQFHPEKSHKFGLAMFRNFVRWAASPDTK